MFRNIIERIYNAWRMLVWKWGPIEQREVTVWLKETLASPWKCIIVIQRKNRKDEIYVDGSRDDYYPYEKEFDTAYEVCYFTGHDSMESPLRKPRKTFKELFGPNGVGE